MTAETLGVYECLPSKGFRNCGRIFVSMKFETARELLFDQMSLAQSVV